MKTAKIIESNEQYKSIDSQLLSMLFFKIYKRIIKFSQANYLLGQYSSCPASQISFIDSKRECCEIREAINQQVSFIDSKKSYFAKPFVVKNEILF